jgi:hypothetical protein
MGSLYDAHVWFHRFLRQGCESAVHSGGGTARLLRGADLL